MAPKDLFKKYSVLRNFIDRLRSRTVKGVSKVIVFGSAANGTASIHSDIDIVVLTDNAGTAIKDEIRNIAYEAMQEDGFNRLILLHFMEESRFVSLLSSGYSFEREIESEGVPLWQAA